MWRKAPTWKSSLDSDGAKDMLVLHTLFRSLPWWQLQPDQDFFASGEGRGKDLQRRCGRLGQELGDGLLQQPLDGEAQPEPFDPRAVACHLGRSPNRQA